MELKLSDLVVAKQQKVVGEIMYDKDWNVKFKMAFLPKTELQQMLGKFTKTVFNSKTHQKDQEIDSDRLSEEILKNFVLGWSGVTYEWLKTQVPLDTSKIENLKQEISFSYDNLKILTDNIYGLDGWILESVKNASNFNQDKKEEEIKN